MSRCSENRLICIALKCLRVSDSHADRNDVSANIAAAVGFVFIVIASFFSIIRKYFSSQMSIHSKFNAAETHISSQFD